MSGGSRYQARWDGALVATTFGAMALVLLVAVTVVSTAARAGQPVVLGVALVAALPGLAVVAGCAWWSPRAFTIDGAALRVERRAGAVVIPLASIRDVQRLDDHLRLARVFGVGGVFGYYGDYRVDGLGHVKLYATRGDGRVAVITTGGIVVVTPARPASFVSELRGRLAAPTRS